MVLRRSGDRCDPKYAFTWAFVLGGFSNAFFQSTFAAPYTAIMFWTLLAVLAVMNQNIVVASEAKISSTGADEDTVSEGINLAGVGKPVPT